MKTISPDTDLKAEQFLIELIRQAPFHKRIELVSSLIRTTRRLSWHAICERYPDATEGQRIQKFVALLYGDELLAQRVAELAVKKLR